MKANPNNHEKLSNLTVKLLGSGEIHDEWNMSKEGSNALILPRKSKSKVSSRNKATDSPTISKTKQRKLQKLEEEKKKKLMLSKSIEMLQKYRLRDDTLSILQSSGTIGKAETLREKRRLAIQYSKVGLEVPDSVSIFKKVMRTSEGDVLVRPSDQRDLVVCSDEGLQVMKRLDKDDCISSTCKKLAESNNCNGTSHVKLIEKDISNAATVTELVSAANDSQQHPLDSHLASASKTSKSSNIESDMMFSSLENEDKISNQFSHESVKSSIPKLFITDSQSNSSLQGAVEANKYTAKPEAPIQFATNGYVNSTIVVHVSRPDEVEKKRRDLPIIMMEQEIMEAINEHPILILCGETGCGKTTQVPQFLYEAGYGSSKYTDRKGIIGITQPRRVAVLATAKRVSYELGLNLGKEVGFQVRHDKMIGNNCSVKFMTDGILLREIQSDFLLKRYSVIILDEAHERSLNTDILVGMLSRIIKERNKLCEEQRKKLLSGVKICPEDLITKLKLVLMSATLRVEDFVSNKKLFQEAPPVLEVPVRQFPVTIHFSRKTPEDYLGQAYKKVLSIHKRLPPGGILVFATGQREVEYLCKKLRKASEKFCDIGVKKMDNETPTSYELDMKNVNDSFVAEDCDSPNQQNDKFCSFEDDDFEEIDEYSSESDAESESVEDSEEESIVKNEDQVGNGSVLDFLDDSESLASLRTAFQALAGNIPNKNHEEKLNVPSTEPSTAVVPLYVLPLYAMLPVSAQLRVFEQVPDGERLVVISTNVAETSLTIPGIKYVVDTGKEKVKNYNHSNGMANFEVHWISKASAAQRAGRAGRTAPGHCYRLYSSAAFGKDDIFTDFSVPEISKVPVDGVVLLMKSLGIHKVENFPFPTPPETSALEEAERCLKAIDALDEKGKLTSSGKIMAHFPMSPRHSRMIITVIQSLRNQNGFTRANLVLAYAAAAAAALSFPDPFIMQNGGIEGTERTDMDQDPKNHDDERSKDRQEKLKRKKMKTMLKETRARFCNPNSDALTVAYALQLFELAENGFEFCRNNFLHLKTMEEMSKLRKQVLHLIFHQQRNDSEVSWDHGSFRDVEGAWLVHSSKFPLQLNEEELLAQAICSGWADRVAKRTRTISALSENEHKPNTARYQSCAMDDTIYLHRRSSVSRTAPEFLVYNELLCTNRAYMHGVTSVKSDWLTRYASSLCVFSSPLADPKPFYEPLNDCTFCWVNPTFGRHNWKLPLHSLPIKNEVLRVSVFASALLEGNVLPCLKNARDFLAAVPTSILRPEAMGHRRVVDLLRRLKMGSSIVDSRAKLKELWSENPMFLHLELKGWYQARFHGEFEKLWEMLLQEVQLEGFELFPKRAKKDRKIVR